MYLSNCYSISSYDTGILRVCGDIVLVINVMKTPQQHQPA